MKKINQHKKKYFILICNLTDNNDNNKKTTTKIVFGACKFSQIVSPQARRSSSPTWTRRTDPTALRMSSPTYRSSTDWAKRWDRAKAWRTNAALAAGHCDVVDTLNSWDVAGSCQSHGAAGTGRQDQGENLRQAKDLFCRSGTVCFFF